MSPSRNRPVSSGGRAFARGGRGGFTLLDAGLGVAIVVLAAVFAVTLAARRQHAARCERLAIELREFAAAFREFAAEHGAPPPSNQGDLAIPRGMETRLRETNWLNATPVGGHFRWHEAGGDERAGPPARGEVFGSIMVTAFARQPPLSLSRADLCRIDEALDDGNPATGDFRAGFNGWPVLLVRAKK